ncbi:helix-turn-helix domain-containing protein [Glacieibacterium sp.]|uniref:helix-turn-helix domain-containing protein n=1 Tax=Glacieibacterium sp. TaxID=2860237 RepID=UPI003B004B9A
MSQITERAPLPDRLGATLAAARVAAGRELDDIARETRVPLRHLRAIEADAHDSLPALPYSVGFVKSFARAVGLDGEVAGARFRAETSKTAHVPAQAQLEPLDERRLPSRGLVMASVVLLVLLLGGLTAYGSGWFDARPESQTATAVPAASEATVTPPVTETANAGTAASVPVPVPTEPASDVVTTPVPAGPGSGVAITANEDAWVRIFAVSAETGRPVTVHTGVITKGQTYDLPATPGLRLWTGRAGALKITVNGRVIPSLGGPVETVRNVSLTPSDLLARIAPRPATATGAP